jgi:transposase
VGGGAGRARQPGDDEPGAGQARPDAQNKALVAGERDEAERAAFRAAAAALDPASLVFLDETSTPTTLTPLRARSPRGERAVGRVPRGRREQVTLVAALTPAGVAAPVLLPGALDGPAFAAWVAQQLVPALRPGQTVLLDNLSVHKNADARRQIEAAGCALRFLPRYSPDLNPIEQAFAKVKGALRRAEARSFDALAAAAKPAIDAVTPADARAFFAAAGYPLPAQLQ